MSKLTAIFARLLKRRSGFSACTAESSLASVYDHAQPASPLPQSATQTRQALAQRRALKKRSNTPRKVLSLYEAKHNILARGQSRD